MHRFWPTLPFKSLCASNLARSMPAVKAVAISCESFAHLDKILARRIIIVHILAAVLAIPCAPLTKPSRNRFSMLFWDFKALRRARISLRSLARTMMDFLRVYFFLRNFLELDYCSFGRGIRFLGSKGRNSGVQAS